MDRHSANTRARQRGRAITRSLAERFGDDAGEQRPWRLAARAVGAERREGLLDRLLRLALQRRGLLETGFRRVVCHAALDWLVADDGHQHPHQFHGPPPGHACRHLIRRTDGIHCRSEEHTSELQSLMRISYAVFCLTKKKTA